MHTCTDRIVQPCWHVFGLGQTADDNTETFLYQGNYNSLLQSWLGKDYWAGSKFPALSCIVGSGSWGGITAPQLRERDVWRQISEVFNPTPAAGEQWLSLVGFTRAGHSSDWTSVSWEDGGVLGRERKALGLVAEVGIRSHFSWQRWAREIWLNLMNGFGAPLWWLQCWSMH